MQAGRCSKSQFESIVPPEMPRAKQIKQQFIDVVLEESRFM